MAGEDSHLWQVQDSASSGSRADATATNTVSFNETTITTTGGFVYTSEFNIRNSIPESELIAGNNNHIEDMGIDGVDITLAGTVFDSDSSEDAGHKIKKLMIWITGDQITSGSFGVLGRFGLQLDNFPTFNVQPTATFGYMIQSLRFIREPDEINKVNFVIILRLSGDITGLGTP